MDGLTKPAMVVSVGANGTEDDGYVIWRHSEAVQDRMGEHRPRGRVTVATNDIPNIVKVPGNCREFLLPLVILQKPEHVPRDVRDQPNVTEAMLREPENAEVFVGLADKRLDLGVVPDRLKTQARFRAGRLGRGIRLYVCLPVLGLIPKWNEDRTLFHGRRSHGHVFPI